MSEETTKHFEELKGMRVPAKRAAYSDRTAWTMALLAELAYTPFDAENDTKLTDLASEFAKLAATGRNEDELKAAAEDRLRTFLDTVRKLDTGQAGDAVLKAALKAGGFELVGGAPIHEPTTDTQAFVVTRPATGDDLGLTVIVFRGTTSIRDWMKNVDIRTAPVHNPKEGQDGIIGSFHKGFHDNYMSVDARINTLLEGTEGTPLYITGHSLGGALAVVATWYQSASRLAACYTFGAPRVGDHNLMGWFKTPIYRIVNAADPVPFVPPSGASVNVGKFILRLLDNVLPFAGVFGWLLDKAIKVQPFRHYGDIRYLPFADPGPAADYPGMQLYTGVSGIERLLRFFRVIHVPARSDKGGKRDRVDKYHDMARYRDKLRAIARARN